MTIVYKVPPPETERAMRDDTELMAVSRLTTILTELRRQAGDHVAERALAYAAARAGFDLPIIRLTPRKLATPASFAAVPARPAKERAPNSTRGPDWPRPCPYCGQTIGSASGWRGHVRAKHADRPLDPPPASIAAPTPPAADLPPPPEPATFLPATHPAASISHWPKPTPQRCPYCDQRLGSVAGLARHYQTKHPDRPRLPGRPLLPESAPESAPESPPEPEPLPFDERPVQYECRYCGREDFLTKASRDGHMSHCPARAPVATPEPVTMVGEPPHPGTLDYLWRKSWPRPCPECWKQGTRWDAAGPRAMADHRYHTHGIPIDAGHRTQQSLRSRPAVPSTDARGWSCESCHSAAFARHRDSSLCVRCHALKPTDVAVS